MLRLAARLERQVRALGAGLAAEATVESVSSLEWLALCQLEETPGVPLKLLAASLHMPASSASRLLQGLTERGLVESRCASSSRRTYAIELTELGRQRRQAARPTAHGPMRQAICTLSEDDLETAIRILGECLGRGIEGR